MPKRKTVVVLPRSGVPGTSRDGRGIKRLPSRFSQRRPHWGSIGTRAADVLDFKLEMSRNFRTVPAFLQIRQPEYAGLYLLGQHGQ